MFLHGFPVEDNKTKLIKVLKNRKISSRVYGEKCSSSNFAQSAKIWTSEISVSACPVKNKITGQDWYSIKVGSSVYATEA